MDGLREGIGLRGYASRDPKLEYQREGYALFEETNARIDVQALELVYKFALPEPVLEPETRSASPLAGMARRRASPGAQGAPSRGAPGRAGADGGKSGKVGRNEPCPCGSGKKFKKCCGAT
jgi:preprotein translocase subunit SecA